MKKTANAEQERGQNPEEPIEFPYTYTKPKCSVSFKIYKTPRQEYDAFTLVYYQDRERKRKLCSTFEAALAEADEVAKLLGSKDVDVLELRSADRAAYRRAREVLDPLGISIEVAAVQYAHMVKILGDTPPVSAAEYYARKHPSKIVAKTVPVVVKEFLEAKEADGCSKRYVKTLKYNLGQFAKRFQGNIEPVVGGEVDAWLRSSGLSPRTRNNIRTSLYTLFKFAEGRRYLPKDHDELDSVPVVNDRDGDIEVFTAAELTEIICCASERMVPFIVLGAFAGIRHAEIQRLEWKDVRFDEGHIEIRASKAKTASRRLVPILPNAERVVARASAAGGAGGVTAQRGFRAASDCEEGKRIAAGGLGGSARQDGRGFEAGGSAGERTGGEAPEGQAAEPEGRGPARRRDGGDRGLGAVRLETQRAAAFVHQLPAGGDPEYGTGRAGSGEQPANDFPALPGTGAADGRGEVVCGHVGERRGGESCPRGWGGEQDCPAAENSGGVSGGEGRAEALAAPVATGDGSASKATSAAGPRQHLRANERH